MWFFSRRKFSLFLILSCNCAIFHSNVPKGNLGTLNGFYFSLLVSYFAVSKMFLSYPSLFPCGRDKMTCLMKS